MSPVDRFRRIEANLSYAENRSVSQARQLQVDLQMIAIEGLAEWAHGSERMRYDRPKLDEILSSVTAWLQVFDPTFRKPEVILGNTENFRG